jgi:transcriptional regulator of arginine metabolism
MANACAVTVDGLRLREIVGTLAGDDTILVVMRSEEASASLAQRLDDMARTGAVPAHGGASRAEPLAAP